jgi:hypothetical protein
VGTLLGAAASALLPMIINKIRGQGRVGGRRRRRRQKGGMWSGMRPDGTFPAYNPNIVN